MPNLNWKQINTTCFCKLHIDADLSYPAWPPASIWLASVTSLDQTSNCHLRRPSTPQCTRPLCMPTRMFTFTPVTSRTNLQSRMHDNWKAYRGANGTEAVVENGVKRTRSLQSCPPPSPRSNERDLPSVPEAQTHSNNNPPGSWSADSGFPENTDITYRKHINSHYFRALEKILNSRGLKMIF